MKIKKSAGDCLPAINDQLSIVNGAFLCSLTKPHETILNSKLLNQKATGRSRAVAFLLHCSILLSSPYPEAANHIISEVSGSRPPESTGEIAGDILSHRTILRDVEGNG